MAKTSWLQVTSSGGAFTAPQIDLLTGDLASLMMGDEVTILKVFGQVHFFLDASVNALSSITMQGLTVQNLNLTATEVPSLLSATPSEDVDGFWLAKDSIQVNGSEVDDRVVTLNYDTSSKRVMRGDERLMLKTEASVDPTANGVSFDFWFRILVLSG